MFMYHSVVELDDSLFYTHLFPCLPALVILQSLFVVNLSLEFRLFPTSHSSTGRQPDTRLATLPRGSETVLALRNANP